MHHQVLNIAIGLLCHRGKILVGWREATQHQGNKYEFPGGKCEADELPVNACRREVYEEVGLDIAAWRSLGCSEFDYGDVYLRLHWFQTQIDVQDLNAKMAKIIPHNPSQVTTQNLKHKADDIADPSGLWQWIEREALLNVKFPKANRSILARLQWPRLLKISASLDAVNCADELLYWRPDIVQLNAVILQQLLQLAPEVLARVVMNYSHWQQLPLALQQQLQTVHLKQHQLLQMTAAQLHPQLRYIAACHDAASLNKAKQLHCDAVLLSPVQSTRTHPLNKPLGWDDFAVLAANCHVPIYALGGVAPSDLEHALTYGAYGVAGISQF